MANKAFNGTTLSIGGAVASLDGISWDTSAPAVDVSDSADTAALSELGVPKSSFTADLIGGTALTVGTEGAVTIAFFDGTSKTMAKGVITSVRVTGKRDGAITTQITVCNTD